MKIYLDLLFLLNFGFDFLLLLVVSIILRRNVGIFRIIMGGLIGGISIFVLFFKINSFELFLFKILISIVMIFVSFSYRNIRYFMKNFFFLYSASMILGGFLYFLNTEFSYKQEGLVFYHDGLSINFIFLIIFSPLILYIYVKQAKMLKNNFSNYYKVNLYYNHQKIRLNAFLDTGNKLTDPYSGKPIIIINKNIIKKEPSDFFMVPIRTINENSLIKCIKIDELEVVGICKKKKVLVGLVNKKLEMEGVDCILQPSILEG